MTTVELLPWIHSEKHLAHKELLKYLKKIKANSYIAMEISKDEIKQFSHGKKFNDDILGILFNKNCKIIPLETKKCVEIEEKTYKKMRKLKSIYQKLIEYTKDTLGNDRLWIVEANKIIKRHKPKKLYLISGAGHSLYLSKFLKIRGIKNKINYKYASEHKLLKSSSEIGMKIRLAILKNDEKKLIELAKQSIEINRKYKRI